MGMFIAWLSLIAICYILSHTVSILGWMMAIPFVIIGIIMICATASALTDTDHKI